VLGVGNGNGAAKDEAPKDEAPKDETPKDETPKEVEPPAGGGETEAPEDAVAAAEDGSSDGEAEAPATPEGQP
jgi:hypothetical protein